MPDRAKDTGTGVLYIPSVEQSDAGVYVCTATDGYSSFSDKKILRITGTNVVLISVYFSYFFF